MLKILWGLERCHKEDYLGIRKKMKAKENIVPLRKENSEVAMGDMKKAELLHSYFVLSFFPQKCLMIMPVKE